MAVGLHWRQAFAGVVKLDYARPAQSFVWLGEIAELKTDWWGWHLAIRANWPVRTAARTQVFTELQAGAVYLRPHALTLDGGSQGVFVLRPRGTFKFSPALAAGCSYDLTNSLAAFLQFEIAALTLSQRNVNAAASASRWRFCRQFSAGFRLYF